MKVAYLVSRFPVVTETFVVRELNAVVEERDVEVELFALFPARDHSVHHAAAPWLERLHRPHPLLSLSALAWWLGRRPWRLLSSIAVVTRAHGRRPRRLLRALATVPVAAFHARTMLGLRINHVHAHFASYPALAAWLCWRLTGISYSVTPHAHDLFLDQSFLRPVVRDAAFIIAISRFNKRFLARFGAGTSTPLHLIHCGINPRAYPFRVRTPKHDATLRVVCVASLNEYKGHSVLLDALADSDKKLKRVTVDLIGDGPLRAALEERAARLGIAHRIRFLGGRPEAEVIDALDRADLFVLPSIVARDGRMEGLPVSLMEALACGLPVVSTDLSGIPEIVVEGVTGALARPADVPSLRAALGRALGDGRATRDWAVAGRRLVETEFDVSASAWALAALFRARLASSAETPFSVP